MVKGRKKTTKANEVALEVNAGPELFIQNGKCVAMTADLNFTMAVAPAPPRGRGRGRKKQQTQKQTHTQQRDGARRCECIHVGDVVAIQRHNYHMPWQAAWILSIFDKVDDEELFVQVQWLQPCSVSTCGGCNKDHDQNNSNNNNINNIDGEASFCLAMPMGQIEKTQAERDEVRVKDIVGRFDVASTIPSHHNRHEAILSLSLVSFDSMPQTAGHSGSEPTARWYGVHVPTVSEHSQQHAGDDDVSYHLFILQHLQRHWNQPLDMDGQTALSKTLQHRWHCPIARTENIETEDNVPVARPASRNDSVVVDVVEKENRVVKDNNAILTKRLQDPDHDELPTTSQVAAVSSKGDGSQVEKVPPRTKPPSRQQPRHVAKAPNNNDNNGTTTLASPSEAGMCNTNKRARRLDEDNDDEDSTSTSNDVYDSVEEVVAVRRGRGRAPKKLNRTLPAPMLAQRHDTTAKSSAKHRNAKPVAAAHRKRVEEEVDASEEDVSLDQQDDALSEAIPNDDVDNLSCRDNDGDESDTEQEPADKPNNTNGKKRATGGKSKQPKKKAGALLKKASKQRRVNVKRVSEGGQRKSNRRKTTEITKPVLVPRPNPPNTRARCVDTVAHSDPTGASSIAQTSPSSEMSVSGVTKRTHKTALSNLFKTAKGGVATVSSTPHSQGTSTCSNGDTQSSNSLRHFRAWTTTLPFHVDLSSCRTYYRELDIRPPYGNYDIGDPPEDSSQQRWKVKIGDVVALHWDTRAGKTHFQLKGELWRKQNKYFPFNVPWSVGEIVTMYRTFGSVKETEAAAITNHIQEDLGNLKVEIRWFYRQAELSAVTDSAGTDLEEIFETDQVDDSSADCILAPVKLVDRDKLPGPSDLYLGMPVVELYCRRFWSVHRGSLIPCGGLSGRIQRARIHSKYLAKDAALRSAMEATEAGPLLDTAAGLRASLSDSPAWKQAFAKVIRKLTLTDASVAAQFQGSGLIGREREQQHIFKFLRDAVRGKAKVPSLFVGGPPGLGKTASVRYAIQKLQHEQATGKIPPFQFISLNGMEMMDPFESYVKLCESLSQFGKQRRTPETAAALLQAYFTKEDISNEDKSNAEIIVLLLDELDYLVTKKQTVIYNFFDWPWQTLASNIGRRLVVVGISNTINLPDTLLPSVQSRIGPDRCIFKAYNYQELTTILKSKIRDASPDYVTFEEDAITLAAKKTATRNGDLRRALQFCKTAAENVLKQAEEGTWRHPRQGGHQPVVCIGDIQRASLESPTITIALSSLMPFEALVIVALASLLKTTGRLTGGFDIQEVMTKVESIAAGAGEMQYLPCPTFLEVLDVLQYLGEAQLVVLFTPRSNGRAFRAAQGGSGGAWPIVSLPMDYQDIRTALRKSPHRAIAEKFLSET